MTEEQKLIFDNFNVQKKDSIFHLVLLSHSVRSLGFDQHFENFQNLISEILSECSSFEDCLVDFDSRIESN